MKPQDFWHLYHAIYPRRWLLAALLGVSLTLVAAVCASTPRYYRASALVMPSQAALIKPVIAGTGAALTDAARGPGDQRQMEEQLATLIGLAETANVRERAIKSLKLSVSPLELEELITAEPGRGSIIRISALAKTPGAAVSLANAIAFEFAGYYRDLSGQQAKGNREFLVDALSEAEGKLQSTKDHYQRLKGSKGEAALPVGTADNPFLTQFYALRSQIDETSSQLNETEGRLAAIRAELSRQSPTKQTETSTTENPSTDKLAEQIDGLRRELLIAQTRYTEKHRRVVDLKSQIADLEKQLAHESGRLITKRTVAANPMYDRLRDEITTLRADREAYAAKLGALHRSMNENEQRAAKLADSSVDLVAAAADYDSARARVDQLKQMVDAAQLEVKVSNAQGEIRVVGKAQGAAGPVTRGGPSIAQLVLLGLFLSLGLSVGSVTALAFLDSRVRERQDLQKELGLPVPAVVPVVITDGSGRPLARVTELDPQSPQAEAYRYLRAQLLYQKSGKPIRTVLIATARPNQGGTTTATNLALALAEVGQRVVLVDADLHRPSQHKFFGQSNDFGLSDLLGGDPDYARALHPTDMASLTLLPAGAPVANPAPLLSSGAMGSVLEELRSRADYVVIDAPSLGAFADAMMLGPLVDGVLLVARANQSLGHIEQQAKEMLERVGANIIGAVLNAASPDRVSGWRFHKHYYGTPPAPPAPPAAPAAGPTTIAVPPRGEASLLRRNLRSLIIGAGVLALIAALLVVATHPRHPAAATRPAQAAEVTYALTMVAEVSKSTEVRVTRDGEVLFDGLLTVGGRQIWQADRELEVWAQYPEALHLTLNGRDLGALGKAYDGPLTRRFTVGKETQS